MFHQSVCAPFGVELFHKGTRSHCQSSMIRIPSGELYDEQPPIHHVLTTDSPLTFKRAPDSIFILHVTQGHSDSEHRLTPTRLCLGALHPKQCELLKDEQILLVNYRFMQILGR